MKTRPTIPNIFSRSNTLKRTRHTHVPHVWTFLAGPYEIIKPKKSAFFRPRATSGNLSRKGQLRLLSVNFLAHVLQVPGMTASPQHISSFPNSRAAAKDKTTKPHFRTFRFCTVAVFSRLALVKSWDTRSRVASLLRALPEPFFL